MTLVETKFFRIAYKKIAKKELGKLSTRARDLFHFINEFGNLHNIRDEVSLDFLEDQIQKTETDTCGIFQLHFYKNVSVPSFEKSTENNEKIIRNTIPKLLKKILKLYKDANKEKMELFIQENNVCKKNTVHL